MKKQTTFRKTIEKVWKNRAAIVIAIAATVFMCGLTALEFVALRMEWNLPVLAYVTGDSDSYIFEEYRRKRNVRRGYAARRKSERKFRERYHTG